MKKSLRALSLIGSLLVSARETSAISMQTVFKAFQTLSGASLSTTGSVALYWAVKRFWYYGYRRENPYKKEDIFWMYGCKQDGTIDLTDKEPSPGMEIELDRQCAIRLGRDVGTIGGLTLCAGLYLLYIGLRDLIKETCSTKLLFECRPVRLADNSLNQEEKEEPT